MAFNPDFTNFNEGLQALMRTMMQDWVGRRNDERSMEYLNRSGEMWTKKGEEDAAREIARMVKQNELSGQSMRDAWGYETSKLPPARAMLANMERLDLSGMDSSEQRKEFERLYGSTAPRMEDLTTNYNTTGPNIASLFGWYENPQEHVTQAMRNRESGLERDFKWSQLNFERNKEFNNQSDKMMTSYLGKVKELRNHLTDLRKGKPVIKANPDTGVFEQTTQPMVETQAKVYDDQLGVLGRIETRILGHELKPEDFEWIDDHWDQVKQSAILTKAYDYMADKSKNFKNLNDAVEAATYDTLKQTGEYEPLEAGVGAPLSDSIYLATNGEYSWRESKNADDVKVKKKLYDAYMSLKRALSKDGEQVVDDAMIFGMLQREFSFLDDFLVKESDKPPEEDTTKTIEEATKKPENKSTSTKTSFSMDLRQK